MYFFLNVEPPLSFATCIHNSQYVEKNLENPKLLQGEKQIHFIRTFSCLAWRFDPTMGRIDLIVLFQRLS